jgi:Lrp/AsnC family transcriptional regulator
MHEAGEAAQQHAAAETERHAHVLEVALVDRGGVLGEAAEHSISVATMAGNGLLALRHLRQSVETVSKEGPMAAKTSLDSFDRKILDCLQDQADMPLAEIARKVGLSTTPCWRRINRLQEQGIIRARVALLDRKALNAGVTVFVAVRTAQHNAQWLSRFAKAIASFPEVMDCYRMSGEIDYLIRLALPDIDAYDAFYKRLIARIELSDVTSMFAMEEIKSTTRLPLSYLP